MVFVRMYITKDISMLTKLFTIENIYNNDVADATQHIDHGSPPRGHVLLFVLSDFHNGSCAINFKF